MRSAVAVLSLLVLAAMPPARAQIEVRIGSASPLSGPGAHQGKDIENGARMAIDDLNAQGFAVGGKKVKWVLRAEDDASDPKTGAAVAQKLVDARVAGVVGHLNSGTTVPASKIYHDAGIPRSRRRRPRRSTRARVSGPPSGSSPATGWSGAPWPTMRSPP